MSLEDFPAKYETGSYKSGPNEVIRRRVLISGRVQGVSFRESCRQQAAALGVVGTVENRPDGSVVAAFEGPWKDVEKLIVWCHEGPATANVRGVYVADEQVAGNEVSFEVLR